MGKVVLDPTNEFLLSSQQEAQQMKLYQKGRNLYWSCVGGIGKGGEGRGVGGGGWKRVGDLDNQVELKEVLERVKEK